MDSSRLIDHYGRDSPIKRIRAELIASGADLDNLNAVSLAGVDEFHLGGKAATMAILRSIDARKGQEVLDVGCGIGGAARTIATETGSFVTGIDLTPGFIDAARELSRLVSLDSSTRFEVANATLLDFPANRFDAITMFHVGMNIEDKLGLFTELARVLRPGGSLHVYDIMRMTAGELPYPMPWSSESATSFVASPEEYIDALTAAGLSVSTPTNRLELVQEALASARANPPAVNLSHLMGEGWSTMIGNLAGALNSGLLAPVEIVARPMGAGQSDR